MNIKTVRCTRSVHRPSLNATAINNENKVNNNGKVSPLAFPGISNTTSPISFLTEYFRFCAEKHKIIHIHCTSVTVAEELLSNHTTEECL